MRLLSSPIEAIGQTPLIPLRRIVPEGAARVLIKLEGLNPTGSMKDRGALAMIRKAAADGRLPAGGTVVEYTGGSMGTSLSFVATTLGFRAHMVTSDAFSQEKRDSMAAFGAQLTLVPSDNQRITAALIQEMIETARRLSRQPNHFWTDQLNNADAHEGYHAMGEEIWEQTEGQVDAFVHAIGTAHSIHGTTQALWRHNRQIRIVGIEPAESPIISQGRSGAHYIEGMGLGFIVPLFEPDLVNEIVTVSTEEARAMARRLAREEGIFGGVSTGCNVVAAIRLAERLGPGKTVVTLQCDTGLKYLSTPVFRG
ncbi:MAG: PLP-dependent cysteine synthase family protein [Bacillota bacterium]